MVQRSNCTDHQDPTRQSQERHSQNFRFIGAVFEEPAIVPSSGQVAQEAVGIHAGTGINEHVGFVVAAQSVGGLVGICGGSGIAIVG